ncbi:unnamed protein product [Thlaspi arvense]|uniref:Mediator of RNA polymerase II transcription subunit 16 n=1 Tax=Thlaspi arvense TaxID=13288 RepID=A0AAU9SVR7_THLAR|nr:unnamed protein product [Thlaspi arvense]
MSWMRFCNGHHELIRNNIGGCPPSQVLVLIQSQHSRRNFSRRAPKAQLGGPTFSVYALSSHPALFNFIGPREALHQSGPSGIMAADAIITDSGAMHVAGVPIVNPSTIVVWEVTPGPGNELQTTPKISTGSRVPPSLSSSSWIGFAPLAAYLFNWQEYLISEIKQGKKPTDQEATDAISLSCSPVSNFSAYVSPEAAAQSAATTTWGSGVTAVAFDPTRGGSVIAVVIVEGQYMSPYDPDEGPSITGWRVQRWESSVQPVVLHPIFGNPSSNFGGQVPTQTVWVSRVDMSIPPTQDFKNHQAAAAGPSNAQKEPDSGDYKANKVVFDPFDLPSDIRTLARIVYSAHGGEIAIAFLRGGVHIFSGPTFSPVENYQINVGSAIAAPAFSPTSCCSASVWHNADKDCTMLKIIRVLPPALPRNQSKVDQSTWERAIAERFWWSLLVGVDWWDAVGCTQSAAEDGIGILHYKKRKETGKKNKLPNLDRIKCRLLEGTNAQEVRAMVLDMQARLLLDMLGKGIESALVNPSALVFEPWRSDGETISGINPEAMAVDPALVSSIQAYVDAVLDLASHFITRLRRYASFCRTLASHAASAGTGSNRNMRIVQRLQASRNAQRHADVSSQKLQTGATSKLEEVNSGKPTPALNRIEEAQGFRHPQLGAGVKGIDENSARTTKMGSGNAGQGYTFEEVRVLFHILMDLCKRTAALAHPLPGSQVGSGNIQVRLHYIDGNYTVLPEVVEAALGPHMQNMPRPRGADAAGLLLRELELHPPSEEWHRRNLFGGPGSEPEDLVPSDDTFKQSHHLDLPDAYNRVQNLWPRKRRMSERDAAFGSNTSLGLGAYLGIMGSRRDVVTATWKTGLEGVWYKCIRCLRQTSAFASPGASKQPNTNERETWWTSRWVYCCPMCGGTWVRVV